MSDMPTSRSYPAGTRVANVATKAHGTVTGWTSSGSIGVRWDTGGSTVTPAHHLRGALEIVACKRTRDWWAASELGDACRSCGRPARDHAEAGQ